MNVFKNIGNTSIKLPAIGQGVGLYQWDESHVDVLRTGIDLGMSFIDTAEEYDNGHAEEIVGKAIAGIREKVIIATKFSPEHSSYEGTLKAAEGSLRRLQTDYIDIYQVHWSNPSVPLVETMAAMEKLITEGKVRYIGVCNLYLREVREAQSALVTEKLVSLQTEYNLFDRIIEDDVLPFCERNKITLIAYSPLDQGRVADNNLGKKLLEDLSKKYGKTPAQINLKWLISRSPVVAIPKATNIKHLEENAMAVDFVLEEEDIEKINRIFKKSPINILPSKIRVSPHGQGNRLVYQTIEQAIENQLNHTPSPSELAENILKEEKVKPVRLIHTLDSSKKYDYDLVEGRIRYWAWVIAYGDRPIPAYVRENWP